MKKWICIDNKLCEEELILNKTYIEIESSYHIFNFCVLIKNELGIVTEYYQPYRFVTIDEWREMQLRNIGI